MPLIVMEKGQFLFGNVCFCTVNVTTVNFTTYNTFTVTSSEASDNIKKVMLLLCCLISLYVAWPLDFLALYASIRPCSSTLSLSLRSRLTFMLFLLMACHPIHNLN